MIDNAKRKESPMKTDNARLIETQKPFLRRLATLKVKAHYNGQINLGADLHKWEYTARTGKYCSE